MRNYYCRTLIFSDRFDVTIIRAVFDRPYGFFWGIEKRCRVSTPTPLCFVLYLVFVIRSVRRCHSSLLIPHLIRALIQSLLIMPNLLRTWSLRQVFPFSPLAFSCPMYGSVPTIPRNLSLVRRCRRQLLYVSAVSLYQGGSLLPLLSLWVNAYCLCHFVLSAPVAYRLALSLPLG